MSGGVDSSVSALLLKDAGYDVTGVFIRVWQPPFLECSQAEDRKDAMRVAAELGIPFKTFDLEDVYKRGVVDYMIAEYGKGRVPNPDVMCNAFVKFGGFYDWAIDEEGADFVATGHYACISCEEEIHAESRIKNQELNRCRLLKSADQNKDQTYFLWKLEGKNLDRILFPVGAMMKDEVREIAKNRGLSVADKKDSQGVCFIGKMDMRQFLKHYLDPEPGKVLDTKGRPIGEHEGAVLYTVGQRRGFNVVRKKSDEGAYFVIEKDIEANTITVATKKELPEEEELTKRVELEGVNWINESPAEGEHLEVRFRHRQPLRAGVLESLSPVIFEFEEVQSAVSPGQSLVFYKGEVCLGGGTIKVV